MFNKENPHVKRNVIVTVILVLLVGAALGSFDDPTLPAKAEVKVSKPFVPNVRGLGLIDARRTLKRFHYRPSVKSDALFGVLIEENFTVCKQHDPNGHLVPIEVSKDC